MSRPETDIVRIELPASYSYLSLLGAVIAGVLEQAEVGGERETLLYNIQLAAHEISANIVGHAYGGRHQGRIAFTITLEREPARITIEMLDQGRPWDPAALAMPDLDRAQEHGYGLFIVYSLMDSVTYSSGADGNRWTLVKAL